MKISTKNRITILSVKINVLQSDLFEKNHFELKFMGFYRLPNKLPRFQKNRKLHNLFNGNKQDISFIGILLP